MRIEAKNIDWGVPGKTIVSRVSLVIDSGATVGLIGPNGSGKSSLLRCLAGLRNPTRGYITFNDRDISDWSAREKAKHLAFAEQTVDTDSDLRVADVVMLGRTVHRSRWQAPGAADQEIVADALARLDLTELRHRQWQELSGGERQRAHLARALAQRTEALLLDEPTNHLDVRHQLELMALVADSPQTVVIALHDLTLAARYCDRLVVMHRGTVAADGPAAHVLSPSLLREVFGVEAEIRRDGRGELTVDYHRASEGTFRVHSG